MRAPNNTATAIEPASVAQVRERPRINALDMTKGALVVIMVIYHSFNYSTDYSLGFKYLPFLPPSFILISGFLISKLHCSPQAGLGRGVACRLFLRGLRLLLLFTLLNVAAQLVGRHPPNNGTLGIDHFFSHWFEVYLPGQAGIAAFSILLPISYLLLLAPSLILIHRWNRFALPAITLALITIAVSWDQRGQSSDNLTLLTAGMIGMILGRVPMDYLLRMGRYWFVASMVYVGYVFVGLIVGQPVLLQLLGACIALALIFSVSIRVGESGFSQQRLITLGKYSLVSYIFQIGVLQIFARFFGRLAPYSSSFFCQMLLVLLLMVLVVEIVEWARRKSKWIDTPYRAIFA